MVVASNSDAAFAFCDVTSDTLIIDSDTIYIEQEEVAIANDSTLGLVIASKPVRKQLWCASFSAGVNNTLASVRSNSNSLQLLNDFLGFASLPQPNLCLGVEFGMRIVAIKGSRGSIELTASAGYALSKLKIRHTSVATPSQLQQDSVRSFISDSNELLLAYFTITEAPDIGEEDTLPIPLNRPLLAYNTHDVLASLRATFSRGFNSPRFFLETGVVKRFVQSAENNDPFFLLNEDGEWITVSSERLERRNLLVPHFALGIERKIGGEFSSGNRFITLGARVSASFPSATFSSNALLTMDVKSVGFMIVARAFF